MNVYEYIKSRVKTHGVGKVVTHEILHAACVKFMLREDQVIASYNKESKADKMYYHVDTGQIEILPVH